MAAWTTPTHPPGLDGLRRCVRPMRRAIERLAGVSPARADVLAALLPGVPLNRAWGASGAPPDAVDAAVGICRQVQRWADNEAVLDWEWRPR